MCCRFFKSISGFGCKLSLAAAYILVKESVDLHVQVEEDVINLVKILGHVS
jgi:hypothetical protein